jgi:HK97 gp10 family phage protein
MATSTIQIKGLRELDAILKAFPARLEKNVLRTALRQSANVLRDAAKARAPSQGIAKNITVRSLKSAPQTVYMATAVNKTRDSYHARFLEFGTASYYQGLNTKPASEYAIKPKRKKALMFEVGGEAGSTKIFASKIISKGAAPKPFMRPAIDASLNEMINVFKLAIKLRIQMEFGQIPRQRVTGGLIEGASK